MPHVDPIHAVPGVVTEGFSQWTVLNLSRSRIPSVKVGEQGQDQRPRRPCQIDPAEVRENRAWCVVERESTIVVDENLGVAGAEPVD